MVLKPFSVYQNSNMATRLRGIKQKKLIIHPSTLIERFSIEC